MILINFLSWREESRKHQKITFLMANLIVALSAIVCIVILHVFIENRLAFQKNRTLFLQNHIEMIMKKMSTIANAKLERDDLIEKIKSVQEVQVQRFSVVKLFNDILSVMPEGLHLTKIELRDNDLFIEGEAEASARISELMNNMNKTETLKNPVLNEINQDNPNDAKWFFILKIVKFFSNDTMQHPLKKSINSSNKLREVT